MCFSTIASFLIVKTKICYLEDTSVIRIFIATDKDDVGRANGNGNPRKLSKQTTTFRISKLCRSFIVSSSETAVPSVTTKRGGKGPTCIEAVTSLRNIQRNVDFLLFQIYDARL
jgi:hypothetical protein